MAGDAQVHLEVQEINNAQWTQLLEIVRDASAEDGTVEMEVDAVTVSGSNGMTDVAANGVTVSVYGPAGIDAIRCFVSWLDASSEEVHVHAPDTPFDRLEGVMALQRRHACATGSSEGFEIQSTRIRCIPGQTASAIARLEVVLTDDAIEMAGEVLDAVVGAPVNADDDTARSVLSLVPQAPG